MADKLLAERLNRVLFVVDELLMEHLAGVFVIDKSLTEALIK